jgi:hypothetical protein
MRATPAESWEDPSVGTLTLNCAPDKRGASKVIIPPSAIPD